MQHMSQSTLKPRSKRLSRLGLRPQARRQQYAPHCTMNSVVRHGQLPLMGNASGTSLQLSTAAKDPCRYIGCRRCPVLTLAGLLLSHSHIQFGSRALLLISHSCQLVCVMKVCFVCIKLPADLAQLICHSCILLLHALWLTIMRMHAGCSQTKGEGGA